jgi:ATP-dependent RNA helicase RhlE
VSFDVFAFDPRVMSGIRSAGYTTPTPIQKQAIPPALAGRDLIGLAQTGTGKTAAFALPIIQRLLAGRPGKIRVLVLAPTRELAGQIDETFRLLGQPGNIRSTPIFGGVGFNPQFEKLRAGVDVLVACPGRLLDHLGRKTADLSHVEVLVVDEADRMLDMGFLPDVRRILQKLPAQRQTMLFSATMPSEIRTLVRDILRDPETVQAGDLRPVSSVAHALYPVPTHLKTPLLLEMLKKFETGSVVVFTKTKHRAKKVALQLERAGHQATCLQGNLSQNRREAAIGGFRDGSVKILVATDIASRGIDVSSITHVVNYDMPDTVDAYTHRIGRTGRVDRTGDAVTLATRDDEAMVRAVERRMGEPLARMTMEGFDYKAPAAAGSNIDDRPPREGSGYAGRGQRRPATHAPATHQPHRHAGSTANSSAPRTGQAARRPAAPHRPGQRPAAGRGPTNGRSAQGSNR